MSSRTRPWRGCVRAGDAGRQIASAVIRCYALRGAAGRAKSYAAGKQMTQQELHDLTMFLRKTPRTVQQLVAGLADDDLRRKSSGKEFSVLEHVCHLRDIEQEGYMTRIRKLLSETHPFLPDIDGDKLARERNYNSQKLDAALHAFMVARKENLRAIGNMSPDQLNRSGVFENVGAITLEELLLKMREHDEDHLRAFYQMRERLSNGD